MPPRFVVERVTRTFWKIEDRDQPWRTEFVMFGNGCYSRAWLDIEYAHDTDALASLGRHMIESLEEQEFRRRTGMTRAAAMEAYYAEERRRMDWARQHSWARYEPGPKPF